MIAPGRRQVAAVLVLTLAVQAAGCGGTGDAPGSSRPEAPANRSDTPREEDAQPAARAEPPVGATRSRGALAAGRAYGALLAAYAPVSARVNFLVTAETLRKDAVEAGASQDVFARTGAVRLEIPRMRKVLVRARPRLQRVPLTDDDQRLVQQRMLEAVDARLAALRGLEAMLAAVAAERVVDSRVEELEDQWRADWESSVRAARQATTALQEGRARVGLEPAPEEAIR